MSDPGGPDSSGAAAPEKRRFICMRCGSELRQNEIAHGVRGRWSWAALLGGFLLLATVWLALAADLGEGLPGLVALIAMYGGPALIGLGLILPRVRRYRCHDCGHAGERPLSSRYDRS